MSPKPAEPESKSSNSEAEVSEKTQKPDTTTSYQKSTSSKPMYRTHSSGGPSQPLRGASTKLGAGDPKLRHIQPRSEGESSSGNSGKDRDGYLTHPPTDLPPSSYETTTGDSPWKPRKPKKYSNSIPREQLRDLEQRMDKVENVVGRYVEQRKQTALANSTVPKHSARGDKGSSDSGSGSSR